MLKLERLTVLYDHPGRSISAGAISIVVDSEKEDMKFKIYLKDPDGISDSVHDASRASVNKIPGLSNSEREVLIDFRIKAGFEVGKN